MRELAEKVQNVALNRWYRACDRKKEECEEAVRTSDVVALIRGAVVRALANPTTLHAGVQEVIAEQRRSPDTHSPEAKIRIEMLEQLKGLLRRKPIQRALQSEATAESLDGCASKEDYLLDQWQARWSEQQLYTWVEETHHGRSPPIPPFAEVIAAIEREPFMPEKYEDEPEEFLAFEHASMCNCGYGCQLVEQAEPGTHVSPQDLQDCACEPIDLIALFEETIPRGYKRDREEKEFLLARLRALHEPGTNQWIALRRVVQELCQQTFDDGAPLERQKSLLYELAPLLTFIERFVMDRLPLVLSSVSVRRFCDVLIAATHEAHNRSNAIDGLQKAERERKESDLLGKIREFELPADYLDDDLPLGLDRVPYLEKKLQNIRLITGYRRCHTPQDFIRFFEEELGIPDQKWRDFSWMKTGSRASVEEGGIAQDLRCIVDLIQVDERFQSFPRFRDWVTKSPHSVPPAEALPAIESDEEAIRLLRLEAERLQLTVETLLDPRRCHEFHQLSPVFRRVLIYFSGFPHEEGEEEAAATPTR